MIPRILALASAACLAVALALPPDVDSRAPRSAADAPSAAANPLRTPAPVIPAAPTMGVGEPDPGAGASPSAAAVDPEATPAPATAAPRATRRPRLGRLRTGIASYVHAGLGRRYLAARLPKGTMLRICGPEGCVRRTVSDYGPSRRKHPDRIVDLSWRDFGRVCGDQGMGLCPVRVRVVRG